jgi:hypothetical protein
MRYKSNHSAALLCTFFQEFPQSSTFLITAISIKFFLFHSTVLECLDFSWKWSPRGRYFQGNPRKKKRKNALLNILEPLISLEMCFQAFQWIKRTNELFFKTDDVFLMCTSSVVPARLGPRAPASARLKGAQAFTMPGPSQSPQ